VAEQTFANHTRIVPMYHIGALLPLLVAFFWFAYRFIQVPGMDAGVLLLVDIALIIMFLSIRGQILRVQDRVIRLEMRLRLQSLLPPAQAADASALPVKQLVALRFASDAELPALVADVIAGRLTAPRDIKQRVTAWQADHLRA
jgi:hypothetical protein